MAGSREIAAVPIPVTWILGRHDAWIDPARIREFMAVPARAPRELIELDIGHLPLTSHEAIGLCSRIVTCIGHQVLHEDLEPVIPDPRELVRVRNAEWRRVPKSPLPDRRSYWNDYLLGDADHKLSYDVLNASEDYIAFLDREADLLDLKPEHSVADIGCGTGNFAARLLRRHGHKSRTPCARELNNNLTVSLYWTTSTESGNKGFYVERTETGNPSGWVSIGFVNGAGYSTAEKNYTLIDNNILLNKIYSYRLRQVDFDGNFSYSNEVVVRIKDLQKASWC